MKIVRKTILASSSIELYSCGSFSMYFIRDMLHNLWCREALPSMLSILSCRRDRLEFRAKRSLSVRSVPFLEVWNEGLKMIKEKHIFVRPLKWNRKLVMTYSWCGVHSPLGYRDPQIVKRGIRWRNLTFLFPTYARETSSNQCTKKGNSYFRRDRSKPPRRRGQFGFYRVKTIDFAEKLNFWECKGSFILSAAVVIASHFTYSGEAPTITTSGRYVSKSSQQFYLKWYYFGFAKRLCMLKRTNKNKDENVTS